MTCSEFLARFSEFCDDARDSPAGEPFRRHLGSCASCRRYERVVRRGVELLQSEAPAEPPEDFRERLRHSIYSLDEERRRKRIPAGGSGFAAVVAVAAVLAVLVWTPMARSPEPTVELAPIVAREPASPRPLLTPRTAEPTPWTQLSSGAFFADSDLWARSNALLYEHSHLGRRSREAGFIRTGLR